MAYKVTEKVIDLVAELEKEGYMGTPTLTTAYPTGAKAVLGDAMSVCLTGFSKERLYIVEDTDTGHLVLVGRYNKEEYGPEITVPVIVQLAYDFYQYHKARGYSLPSEFVGLFEKYGHIKKVVKTTETWEET